MVDGDNGIQTHGQRDRALSLAQLVSGPVLRRVPIEAWPRIAGRIYGIGVPRGVVPHAQPSPRGGSNANIITHLLWETIGVPGRTAECGVFRGSSLLMIGQWLRHHDPVRDVCGLDSFEGFDETIGVDIALGGGDSGDKRVGGFSLTSELDLRRRIAALGLDGRVQLLPGFFSDTLQECAGDMFSFVHLDCDIYGSYKACLEFFYPRMSPGGIILLDEYNDPPWPGCNLAVDEFLADREEELALIESDNYQKWYLEKRS